jgi:hypothetical protein
MRSDQKEDTSRILIKYLKWIALSLPVVEPYPVIPEVMN